jgi:hypothetical protein
MKLTMTKLQQIIKEELEHAINEADDIYDSSGGDGRDVIALFVIKKSDPKIPGADIDDLVVLNKEYTGRDDKEYAKYSVYEKGAKPRYKGKPGDADGLMSIPDKIQYGYAKTALNGGTSGESYVVEMDKLKQHDGRKA